MLKKFKYTKADGSVSYRNAFQLSIVGGDKILCVDLTEFEADDIVEYDKLMTEIHNSYIDAIKDLGLGSTFRTFLIDRMD